MPETIVLSGLTVEGNPCPDCGTPFMLSGMAARPLGGLVLPGPSGNGHKEGTPPTVTAIPFKAWRFCIHCLRTEITRPRQDGHGWELVKQKSGGVNLKAHKIAAEKD